MGGARSVFPIGRLFDIALFVDWSWLFIFVLVAWNLGSSFLVLHPSWGWGLAFIGWFLQSAATQSYQQEALPWPLA